MRKALVFLGIAAVLWGLIWLANAWRFIASAKQVTGRVYAVESLAGPPKPRQKIPVHVEYDIDGRTERGETRMPMLGALKQGDSVPLWIPDTDPAHPVIAQPSTLLAKPITVVIVGLVVAILSWVAPKRGG